MERETGLIITITDRAREGMAVMLGGHVTCRSALHSAVAPAVVGHWSCPANRDVFPRTAPAGHKASASVTRTSIVGVAHDDCTQRCVAVFEPVWKRGAKSLVTAKQLLSSPK